MTATEQAAAVPRIDTAGACDMERFLVKIQDWPVTSEPLASRYLGRQWLVHTVASVKRTDELIVLHLLCPNVTLGPLPYENQIY
jgi:hypothetical protein